MVFNDNDLKQLKDYYEDPKRGDTPLKWKALLARLEAAEYALNRLQPYDKDDEAAITAWHASAGK